MFGDHGQWLFKREDKFVSSKEKRNCRTGYCPTLSLSLSLRPSLSLSSLHLPPNEETAAGVDSRCRHSHEMLVTLGGSPKRAHAVGRACTVVRLKGLEVGRFPQEQEL